MTKQRARKEVHINLRKLDGIDLDGEPIEKDGGTTVQQTPEEILKKQMSAKRRRWNTFFLISCALAIFNDPFYCYLEFIDIPKSCVHPNTDLIKTYVVIRLFVDVVYIIDLLISSFGISNKRERIANWFQDCWCCKTSSKGNNSTNIPKTNINVSSKRIKTMLLVISRILVALPILEVSLLVALQTNSSIYPYVFFISTPIQYMLRVYHIYHSLRLRPIIGSGTKRWLKPILDFVPFILASHLFGAIWYLLAVERYIDCWNQNCKAIMGASEQCYLRDFPCEPNPGFNSTILETVCPIKQATPDVFDFGIYLFALQSQVTDSKYKTMGRMLQSVCWALRNLSSFASNLNSSMNPVEIIFCIVISISGMTLFLVYLNARVQESREWSKQQREKKNKQLAKPDIDVWLTKHDFPKGMNSTITQRKMDMSEVIMDNIYKLDEKKDYDVQKIISILPIRDRRRLLYSLRSISLTKVPAFLNMKEKALCEIAEHLEPVIYPRDSYIIQEGKPLGKIIFIINGTALTYTTGMNSVGTSYASSNTQCLQKGDFYGIELLDWAFKFSSFAELPISTGTLVSQEKVEAFVIIANDLKNVVSKYWWYFIRHLGQEQRDHIAASLIQATWRGHHRAKVEGQTDHHNVRWSVFTLN